MSQHDFNIANQGFPAFRADLNSGLEALATNSSGATAPTTTYAYQFWYDESSDLLKMRNGANDAWITLAFFDQATDEWEVRSAVIQAVDAAGVEIKTDDGTTRLDIADDGTVTIVGDLTVSGTLTATLDSNSISEGNSSVEVVDAGTGSIQFTTDGTEAARFDANGRLGVGTTSPSNPITVAHPTDASVEVENTTTQERAGIKFTNAGTLKWTIEKTGGAHPLQIKDDDSEVVGEWDQGKNFKFNSGYGSAATAYGCRAWVRTNENGVILASGNVSSVSKTNQAYKINFSNAMPNSNYSAVATTSLGSTNPYNPTATIDSPTTTSVQVYVQRGDFPGGGSAAPKEIHLAVFR